MGEIRVCGIYNKVPEGFIAVDTTSKSGVWSDLSPFRLGPCDLYDHMVALNMENLWQFAKVYKVHADARGNPTSAYWDWAKQGWADPHPHRYPMGRGAVPLYSLWAGKHLGYIEARKTIYAPAYIKAVRETAGFQTLIDLLKGDVKIMLRDYDGYDHDKLKMTLTEVLHNSERKMGHAFVLKALLTNDPVLQEFVL